MLYIERCCCWSRRLHVGIVPQLTLHPSPRSIQRVRWVFVVTWRLYPHRKFQIFRRIIDKVLLQFTRPISIPLLGGTRLVRSAFFFFFFLPVVVVVTLSRKKKGTQVGAAEFGSHSRKCLVSFFFFLWQLCSLDNLIFFFFYYVFFFKPPRAVNSIHSEM